MKKQFLIYSLLLVLAGLSLATPAHAVGVGVKPKEINLQAKSGKKIAAEILVMNVANEPALYQVYLDDTEKNITLWPRDFQLLPGASQLVKIESRFNWPEKTTSTISVVSRSPEAGGLTAASGIKIPLTIAVYGVTLWTIITGWAIIACLIIISIVLLRKGRNWGPRYINY